jgi:hypothetical protein
MIISRGDNVSHGEGVSVTKDGEFRNGVFTECARIHSTIQQTSVKAPYRSFKFHPIRLGYICLALLSLDDTGRCVGTDVVQHEHPIEHGKWGQMGSRQRVARRKLQATLYNNKRVVLGFLARSSIEFSLAVSTALS